MSIGSSRDVSENARLSFLQWIPSSFFQSHSTRLSNTIIDIVFSGTRLYILCAYSFLQTVTAVGLHCDFSTPGASSWLVVSFTQVLGDILLLYLVKAESRHFDIKRLYTPRLEYRA